MPAKILIIGALILWSREILVVGVNVNDIQDYGDIVLLVSDVQEYYKAASVFIVYAGDEQSLETTTLLHRLLREFSNKFVPSLTLNYSDISLHHNNFKDHIVKPLFIVLLSSQQEVDWFQQATSQYDMSYAVWIVIFTNATLETCYKPPGNYFNLGFDSEMLVKCKADPVIREWYSIHEDETKMRDLITWDPVHRFRLRTEESLYERRRNFGGKDLSVAIVRESTLIAAQQGGQLAGYFASVLMELSKSLNFTFTVVYKEDHFGLYNESLGKWTGAIGRLARGEVEVGVSEFSMTIQRLNVVEFTYPIMLSRNQLYMRQPDGSALNWSAYFKVYTIDVWLAIKAMYILASLIITYMRAKIKEKPIPFDHVSENYLQVWGVYWQQGLPELPKASSMRIAYFSILLKAVVLYAVYSACLISYLTVTSPGLPFNDMEAIANDGSYKIVTARESAHYDFFRISTDKVMRKMMALVREPAYLPRTMSDGFKQVCADKIAFYTTGIVKNLVNSHIPCNVISIDTGRIDSISIALKKGSNYRDCINYHLLKFQDVGIMHRMRTQVYEKVSPADNRYNPVNVGSVVTILLILGVGVLLSLFMLGCEIVVHRTSVARQNRRILSTCKKRIVITKNLMLREYRLPL